MRKQRPLGMMGLRKGRPGAEASSSRRSKKPSSSSSAATAPAAPLNWRRLALMALAMVLAGAFVWSDRRARRAARAGRGGPDGGAGAPVPAPTPAPTADTFVPPAVLVVLREASNPAVAAAYGPHLLRGTVARAVRYGPLQPLQPQPPPPCRRGGLGGMGGNPNALLPSKGPEEINTCVHRLSK